MKTRQSQALNALVVLYKQALEIDLGRLDAVRARRTKRFAWCCGGQTSLRSWFWCKGLRESSG